MFSAVERGAGPRIEVLEDLDGFLDRRQVEAGPLLNDRQAVVLDVFQVVVDQDAHHVAVRRLGRDLQQQAFLAGRGRRRRAGRASACSFSASSTSAAVQRPVVAAGNVFERHAPGSRCRRCA